MGSHIGEWSRVIGSGRAVVESEGEVPQGGVPFRESGSPVVQSLVKRGGVALKFSCPGDNPWVIVG